MEAVLNNGKAQIIEGKHETVITVHSPKNMLVLVFGPIWLIVWAVVLVGIAYSFFTHYDWILGLPIVILICYGGFVLFGVLWSYLGIEELIITQDKVVLRKHIFGLGILNRVEKQNLKYIRRNTHKKRVFFMAWKIDIRHQKEFLGLGKGRIKMNHGDKTLFFATSIDEAEAEYLVEYIKQQLER